MILTLAHAYGVFLLALISPGPDFAVTVKNSLMRGKRAGQLCALGVAIANSFHVVLVNLGLGALVAESAYLYRGLVWVAALYLGYLGVSVLLAKPTPIAAPSEGTEKPLNDANLRSPLIEGLLVNALNAKAILFWISFFALVFRERVSSGVRIGFISVMILTLLAWFSFVAAVLSQPAARELFFKHENRFNRVMGLLLLALAIRVVTTL